MNTDIKVTVIIPIYNTEKYIADCLDSILNQTLKEIEIVCVDDGSTDNTPDILDEYAEKHSQITVLHQHNQYAGAARNAGKRIARGEYLVFWDSDDFFDSTALELMYNQCKQDDADICVCSAFDYMEDIQKNFLSSSYLNMKYVPEMRPFNRETIPDYILNFTTAHPWNKMFRRGFIENIGLDFQTTRNGNDIYFVINSLCFAERITVVNKPLIYYRTNQTDSLFSSLSKSPLTPIKNWIATRDNLLVHGLFPEKSFVNKVLGSIFYFLHNINEWDAYKTTFLFLQKEGLDNLSVKNYMSTGEDYYTKWHKETLLHLVNDSPEEFLIYFSYLTYCQKIKQAAHAREAKASLKKSRKKIKTLKSQLTDLSSENQLQLNDIRRSYYKKLRLYGLFLSCCFVVIVLILLFFILF